MPLALISSGPLPGPLRLAQGRNPADVTAGELAQGKPVTIGADDDAAEVLRTMAAVTSDAFAAVQFVGCAVHADQEHVQACQQDGRLTDSRSVELPDPSVAALRASSGADSVDGSRFHHAAQMVLDCPSGQPRHVRQLAGGRLAT